MNLLHHHMNWKLSERNPPDFLQVLHYNDLLIDYVTYLYESISVFSKYVNQEISTKYMVETSPYGIILIDKEQTELRHIEPVQVLTKYLHYLALVQRSDVAYTGVKWNKKLRFWLTHFLPHTWKF